MNQAFFKRVFVTEDGITGHEWAEPFASLMAVTEAEPLTEGQTEPGWSLAASVRAEARARATNGNAPAVGPGRSLPRV